MHINNSWTDLTGAKHNGLHVMAQESLKDCIVSPKLVVFTADTAEKLKYYLMLMLMCYIKKPLRYTIQGQPVVHMELINKYVGLILTIKNSPKAVASMGMGNVPFNEATLASVILASLPPAWRNQHGLAHTTVPKSHRGMLVPLKNIKIMFVQKNHEKARANKAKAATASQANRDHVPRKRMHEGSANNNKGAPKKGSSAKYCRMRKAAGRSFNTRDTSACHRFEKDGMPKASSVKPFDSTKKPWKKTGSGEASQITYLTKKLAKLETKVRNTSSKKHAKKHARDLG